MAMTQLPLTDDAKHQTTSHMPRATSAKAITNAKRTHKLVHTSENVHAMLTAQC